ncbi:MAG: GNAT family N-acetyltransferase [Bacteroidota bacterium]|nr:GNAT family N-acetyltransferase [Bacteroidota bacterium]MDX5506535.1 GNAT family N-acetyltransferase [Bacteroidota bacterium]
MPEPEIRPIQEEDIPGVFRLVQQLALYEKAPEQVTLTVERMISDLKKGYFRGFVLDLEGQIIGMAIYYPRYSTWKGLTYHLEDFIVDEPYRRNGFGKRLFDAVAEVALRDGVHRFEWEVLEWNEPALDFYRKVGASLDPEWFLGKMDREALGKYLQDPKRNRR